MITPPVAGEDCRKLHRKVSEVTSALTSLINMTVQLEGRSRGLGFLGLQGNSSFVRIYAQRHLSASTPIQPSALTLTSSSNPVLEGAPVTFTAQMTPAQATGTVQFKIDGANFGAPVPLNNGIARSAAISSLQWPDDHQIDASYSGDTHYQPAHASLSQGVKATSSVTVTSSLNPSIEGQWVRWTATIQPDDPSGALQAPGNPSGFVQFKIDGVNFGPPVNIGSAPDDNNINQAISQYTNTLGDGDHTITAQYLGDRRHTPDSGTFTQHVDAVQQAQNFRIDGPTVIGSPAYYLYTVYAETNGQPVPGFNGIAYCHADMPGATNPLIDVYINNQLADQSAFVAVFFQNGRAVFNLFVKSYTTNQALNITLRADVYQGGPLLASPTLDVDVIT